MLLPVGPIASAVERDLGEDEFGGEVAFGEVGGDSLFRLFRGNFGIEEHKHGWARSAESGAEDAGISFEFLERGQQRTERRAIRLVNAVFERRGEQVGTILRERREQQHRVLNVGDGIGARVLEGQDAAGLLGREQGIGDSQQQWPLPFRLHFDHLRLHLIGHASHGKRAHPAGRGVVGMVLAHGSFADDAVVLPAQMSEMHSQCDPCQAGGGGRSATSADGNLVFDVNAQRCDLAVLRFEDLAIGGDDEVVLHAGADRCVAAFGGDKKVGGALDPQAKMEIQGEGSGVKGRAQIGGSRREHQAQRAI